VWADLAETRHRDLARVRKESIFVLDLLQERRFLLTPSARQAFFFAGNIRVPERGSEAC
jgi:hypothetical protein